MKKKIKFERNFLFIFEIKALRLITATVENLHCLSAENYDTLATNITQYSAKLLKKNDQCISVLQCTHLFFNKHYVRFNYINNFYFLKLEK